MKRLLIILLLCSTAMAAYEPFPIFDLKAGKITAREAWLLPQDGFETLRNCHLKDGVLEKRRGYSKFGQMLYADTTTKNPTLKTDPIMGVFNWYSTTEQLIIMDPCRVGKYETSFIAGLSIASVADNGSGKVRATTTTTHGLAIGDMVTLSDCSVSAYDGTYDVTAVNAGNKTFDLSALVYSATSTGTAEQEPFNDLTTSKIRFTYYDTATTPYSDHDVQVHAAVVDEVLKQGATTATVRGITIDTGSWADTDASGTFHLSDLDTGSDQSGTFVAGNVTDPCGNVVGYVWGDSGDEEFTGDNTDFFWVENWKGISYIINDNDVIQKYDGTNLTELFIDLDEEGGGENDVTTCLLIFAMKSRLIIFSTDESGDGVVKQRARWSEINDPQTWKNANFVDAPTEEWIVSAGFLGDEMIVFFERSVWSFSYTGDPDFPFRWDRIDAVKGGFATMSLISFSDQILTVGPTQLIGTDGREAYTIDDKIPEFVVSWVVNSTPYSYGLLLDEERQAWISYTSTSATAHADGNIYADSAIILNYTDNAWATYELPIHSLGQSALESDLTWNDVTDAWEDIDYSWNEKSIQGGFPLTLMGSRDGFVYQLNTTGSDSGTDIEFSAVTGRWNPYQTRQARLGWVDFLVDTDSGASFDVKFYLNSEASSYQTSTINCTETGTARDKVWKRANSGAVGDYHRLEITNNASTNRPRIHAIVPYFKPAGSLF